MEIFNKVDSDGPLPALRQDLQAFPAEVEGKRVVLLQDLEGFSPHPVALSPDGLTVASLLDGRNTAAELRSAFAQATGMLLSAAEIHDIVQQLEQAQLLETPEIAAKRRRILDDFLAGPTRKAALQGTSYPADPLELAGLLGGYFRDPKGPGELASDANPKAAPPIGLVSPHMDFGRGGPAYAWAYRALAQCEPPDLIVALGVAHASPDSPWTLTRKAYETPYGPMAVHEELYEEFQNHLWYDAREDEWVHRKEHSLELQAVWLKFLWREKTPPWVPVLCSAFDRFCPDRPPSEIPTLEEAVQNIGRRLAHRAKTQKILILAGVDLAHVGPRFGDDLEPGPELEKRVESEDRRSLEHAMALDADAFYLSAVADGHWRKICGLSALYTSLRWIKFLRGDKPGAGNLLTYGQAPDPLGGIVSFAGAVFPRNG